MKTCLFRTITRGILNHKLMRTRQETKGGMSLFKDDILNSFILHIPHASTDIPTLEGFVLDKVEENTGAIQNVAVI